MLLMLQSFGLVFLLLLSLGCVALLLEWSMLSRISTWLFHLLFLGLLGVLLSH